MVAKKPRIVIIGAGMAGLTAANKLHTSAGGSFDICVVDGGARIGGRIDTAEFCGARVEMGATWIHGIGGSPIHRIAQQIGSLASSQPWEGMDGVSGEAVTVAEGGCELDTASRIVEPVSTLFRNLTEVSEGKNKEVDGLSVSSLTASDGKLSVGEFLRRGLAVYRDEAAEDDRSEAEGLHGDWRRRSLEEAVFAMRENVQRTHTAADDLGTLDFAAEREYCLFPGEEITIPKGYATVVESLASVLPPGAIHLRHKVTRIEWRAEAESDGPSGVCCRPVKIHFCNGSAWSADHVIVTVSLGVLKAGIRDDRGLFDPSLPSYKAESISRLGFGVVDKLFLKMPLKDSSHMGGCPDAFPFLQMAFRQPDSELRHPKIPGWMRRTASISPIHRGSDILLSWFAGKEALELESLRDVEIIEGISETLSSFLPARQPHKQTLSGFLPARQPHKQTLSSFLPTRQPHKHVNVSGVDNMGSSDGREFKFKVAKILKSQWGTDPLFLGSYSYVAVGSSGADMDSLAEPLPGNSNGGNDPGRAASWPPLQILFAGEATHRTHYSTTHGAYFSGVREATRLLKHYNMQN